MSGRKPGVDPPIHLVIPTHTPHRLDLVLFSIAQQVVPPTTLTVSCDVDDAAIEAVIRRSADRFNLCARYVRRPHQGTARISQVRNNAVRALLESGVEPTGRILIIDGDTCLLPETVALHARLGGAQGMVCASRVMLSPERSDAFDLELLAAGRQRLALEPGDDQPLQEAHRRARIQQWLRHFRLAKAHKPKILGGHFSIRFDLYCEVNGCDEEFEGYGMEDDDLARRAYRAGADSVVAIRDIPVLHLHHPTRAARDWADNPGFARMKRRDLPVVCLRGLRNPMDQDDVSMDVIGPRSALS